MKNDEATKKATKTIVIIYLAYIIYLTIMYMYIYGISIRKLCSKIKGKIVYFLHKIFSKNKYPDFESNKDAESYFSNKIQSCEKTIAKIEEKINKYMNRMDKYQEKVKQLSLDFKQYV